MISDKSMLLENGESNTYSTCSLEKQTSAEDGKCSERRKAAKSRWTRQQVLTAVILTLLTLCQGICFSVIAPFFPSEAARKGASSTVVGLVFGVFQLVVVISSPIYGYLIGKIGAKFLCCLGALLLAGCSIVFGFLDKLPDGPVYIAMCFICRIIEGNGSSMVSTSAFALMASTFPKDIGTVVGVIETAIGVGLMIGPSVGGALYSVGGYPLPFVVVGGIMLVVAIAACFTLPKADGLKDFSGNIFALLKVPGCLVLYVITVICAVSISYLDPTFSPFVEESFPWVTVAELGLIFTIHPAAYAICGPINGFISDRWSQGTLCLAGLIIEAIAYFLLGPNPWLATFIPTTIPETAIALVAIGIGASCVIVPIFSMLNRLVRNEGLPEGLQTFGLVSGFFSSAFAFGSFLGPTVAGSLADEYGFAWSSSFCAFLNLAGIALLATYMGVMRFVGKWPIPIPDDTSNAKLAEREISDKSANSP